MNTMWTAIQALRGRWWGGDRQRRDQTLRKMDIQFTDTQRDNEDSLRQIKDDIRALEARVLQKKREMEGSHGETRRIIVGEIERLFRAMDRIRDRETVVAENLDRMSKACAKIAEARAALRAGVTEEQLDTVALEIQDSFADLRTLDRAAKDLDEEKYEPTAATRMDVTRRMAETQGTAESPVDLSPETEKRLKLLETE